MQIEQYSSSIKIYLQRLQAYINTGEGYSSIRKYLFQELNKEAERLQESNEYSQVSYMDTLSFSLFKLVESNLSIFERSQKILHVVTLIEEFLTYAEGCFTNMMHDAQFVGALLKVANFNKPFSFNPEARNEYKMKICGIFMFWHEKYQHHKPPYSLFLKGYLELKEKKLVFPFKCPIIPNTIFKVATNKGIPQNKQQNKQQNKVIQTTGFTLEQISKLVNETEKLAGANISQIATTECVRMLKHKSKMLYDLASHPQKLCQSEKQTTKILYKRLRNLLKEIDAYNENRIREDIIRKEVEYVERKIQIMNTSRGYASPQKNLPEDDEFGAYEGSTLNIPSNSPSNIPSNSGASNRTPCSPAQSQNPPRTIKKPPVVEMNLLDLIDMSPKISSQNHIDQIKESIVNPFQVIEAPPLFQSILLDNPMSPMKLHSEHHSDNYLEHSASKISEKAVNLWEKGTNLISNLIGNQKQALKSNGSILSDEMDDLGSNFLTLHKTGSLQSQPELREPQIDLEILANKLLAEGSPTRVKAEVYTDMAQQFLSPQSSNSHEDVLLVKLEKSKSQVSSGRSDDEEKRMS